MTATKPIFPSKLIPLWQSLKGIALRPSHTGTHTKKNAPLYHYTSTCGLNGILSSGQIWATRLSCLDDEEEMRHPRDSCIRYL